MVSKWDNDNHSATERLRNACVGHGEGAHTVSEARDAFQWRAEGMTGVSLKIDAPCSCHNALGWWLVCGLSRELGGCQSISEKLRNKYLIL